MTSALVFLRRQAFALAIIACACSAFMFPGWYDSWFGFKLMPFVGPSIQMIMFGMGTTLTLGDFLRVAKTPWSVAVGAVLQFSVMPFAAVETAIALEAIARMARLTLALDPAPRSLPGYVLEKHHQRKHGPNAYYGQAHLAIR